MISTERSGRKMINLSFALGTREFLNEHKRHNTPTWVTIASNHTLYNPWFKETLPFEVTQRIQLKVTLITQVSTYQDITRVGSVKSWLRTSREWIEITCSRQLPRHSGPDAVTAISTPPSHSLPTVHTELDVDWFVPTYTTFHWKSEFRHCNSCNTSYT